MIKDANLNDEQTKKEHQFVAELMTRVNFRNQTKLRHIIISSNTYSFKTALK